MVVERIIVASRGRSPSNPSDRTKGIDLEQRLELNTEGVSNTLSTVQKDNMVLETESCKYGTVLSEDGLSGTLIAGTHGYANNVIQTKYRIRKLTPKECFRLMDFDDADYEAASKVNSDTQLYKQAGNSIVVAVLEEIFRQMI